ncbi:MAG: hypothetical protein IT441_00050 [Phycisphaeraceae bacterium]|nr:hypothetical protein [Phycisphaeraceae bacterium]
MPMAITATPPFRDVYTPGPNINDHSFIRAGDTWHLFHIWLDAKGPLDNVIGHATSKDLITWQRQPDILPKAPKPSWEWHPGANAPYCIEFAGTYYLFYSRYDWPEGRRHQRQHIGVATSPDLFNWTPCPDNPVFHPAPWWSPWEDADSNQFRPGCCRDPHVIRLGDQFVLYYVALTHKPRVCAIGHAVSHDLLHWEDRGPVLEMGLFEREPIMCESPDVVFQGGRWHLFYTQDLSTWHAVADTPFEFSKPARLVSTHASEVFEWDGRWYMSHCCHGGLSLARIDMSANPPRVFGIE